jgi:23S rRNA U2552 (ribose-2'-O)-methylase RlmE/FtsJ
LLESNNLFVCSADPNSRDLFLTEFQNRPGGQVLIELDERSYLCEWGEGEAPYFCQHRFRVAGHTALPDASLETVASANVDLDLGALRGQGYSFQISANRRLDFTFGELIPLWIERFQLPPELHQKRNPAQVISLYIRAESQSCTLYFGTSAVAQNISPWSQGVCRIPRAGDSVSRAEQKLREALEILALARGWDVTGGPSREALDLGSAPGGWTRLMAQLGFAVDSVDPAQLDPAVSSLKLVTHHRTTAGDFLEKCRSKYDVLLSDMKMEAAMAADLACRFQPRLRKSGALILTLKLPKGHRALEHVRDALGRIRKAYTIVQARQLYFNRRELTVLALPHSG